MGIVPEQLFWLYPSAHGAKLVQNTLESDRKYKQLVFPTQIQNGRALYATSNFSSKFLKDC